MGNKDLLKKDEFLKNEEKKLDLGDLSDVSGGDSAKWYKEASANKDFLGDKPKHKKIDS
jgi:hypothetical protein